MKRDFSDIGAGSEFVRSEERPQLITSATVGLFWFSPDYKKITTVEGERKIDNSDLMKPDRVEPIGVHAEYDMPRDQPRGRITYVDGLFRINVGEDCGADDSDVISLIKNTFGLNSISDSKFKVKRHYHWNTKGN